MTLALVCLKFISYYSRSDCTYPKTLFVFALTLDYIVLSKFSLYQFQTLFAFDLALVYLSSFYIIQVQLVPITKHCFCFGFSLLLVHSVLFKFSLYQSQIFVCFGFSLLTFYFVLFKILSTNHKPLFAFDLSLFEFSFILNMSSILNPHLFLFSLPYTLILSVV